MTDNIVERVARAMVEKCAGTPWDQLTASDHDIMHGAARAAIAELREPSEAMLEAVKPWPAHWPKDGPDYPARLAAYRIDQMTAASDWRVMIDTALTEGTEHDQG